MEPIVCAVVRDMRLDGKKGIEVWVSQGMEASFGVEIARAIVERLPERFRRSDRECGRLERMRIVASRGI